MHYQQLAQEQKRAVERIEDIFLNDKRISKSDFIIALSFLINKYRTTNKNK